MRFVGGVLIWLGLGILLAAAAASWLVLRAPQVNDAAIKVTPHMISELRALKSALNFGPSSDGMYTGVPDPVSRAKADAAFAGLIDRLVQDLPSHPSKKFVLDAFWHTLTSLDLFDTEDRERATGYCEKIMDVVGIESSDGVLNRWLYGPILSRMIGKKAKPSAP